MGDLREMNGICLSNISRWSNPLHIVISRDLRDMLREKFQITWKLIKKALYLQNYVMET